jgi:hypothetical protein
VKAITPIAKQKNEMSRVQIMNDENLGSAGASPALFGAPPKSFRWCPSDARDTAGGAPALPASSFSRQRFLDFARNDKNLIGIR